jgi:two-component sensor histidine kinase
MLVLHCDDNPDDLRLAERELRNVFPDIELLTPDSDARFDAALDRPDLGLLITDYELGWTDGLTLLRRAKMARPDLPVLMVTGSGNEEIAAQAMRDGAFDYVTKSRLRRLGPEAGAALEHAAALRARAATEADLRRALKEKEALLEELFHRVNNNLQIVSSLVQAEALRTPHAETRNRLDDLTRRVQAIALVQERLYRAGDYAEVDVKAYLEELVAALTDGRAISVDLDLEELRLPIHRAVPLGLAANELIVNALKHAFGGGTSEAGAASRLSVRLVRGLGSPVPNRGGAAAPPVVLLQIADNGNGIHQTNSTAGGGGGGSGLRLVRSLARQLDGELDIGTAPSGGGTVATIRLPEVEASNGGT